MLVFISNAMAADNTYLNKESGFSITFPQGWKAQEGKKSAVLVTNPAENNTVNMNVLVKSLPQQTREIANADLMDYLATQKLIPGWDTIKDSGEAELDGEKALWMKALTPLTSGDKTLYVASSQIWTIHYGKLFTFTCVAVDKTPEEAQEKFRRNELAFTTAAASLKFTEHGSPWSRKQRGFWGKVTLIFFGVLAIELAIPLLLRFALIKRPLDPFVSGLNAFILFLANVGIFTALGTTMRFNPLFFLFAIAAYLIFNHGYYEYNRNKNFPGKR